MLKRILPLALALCMLTMAGCKKEQDRLSVDKGSEPSVVSETKPVTYKNPLTGVSGISEEKNQKPSGRNYDKQYFNRPAGANRA